MYDFDKIVFTDSFDDAFRALPSSKKKQCRKAIRLLKEDPSYPGLGFKPIKPAGIYWEARINRPDRLVIRPDGDTAYLVAVTDHDNLNRWG